MQGGLPGDGGLDFVRFRDLITEWIESAIEEGHDRGYIGEVRVVDGGIRPRIGRRSSGAHHANKVEVVLKSVFAINLCNRRDILGPAHQIGNDRQARDGIERCQRLRQVRPAGGDVVQMLEVAIAAKQQGRAYTPNHRKHALAGPITQLFRPCVEIRGEFFVQLTNPPQLGADLVFLCRGSHQAVPFNLAANLLRSILPFGLRGNSGIR